MNARAPFWAPKVAIRANAPPASRRTGRSTYVEPSRYVSLSPFRDAAN
jgi:hypothetical protein